MISRPLSFASVFCALVASFLPSLSSGAQFSLKPSISGQAYYTDNIFLRKDKTSAWRTTTTPGLKLDYNIKNFSLNLDAKAGINRYINRSELNTDDQFFRLTSSYARGSNDLKLVVDYDKIATLRTELLDTGELQNFARQRKTLVINPSWLYRLSERTRLTLDYGYRERAYTSPPTSSASTTSGARLVGIAQNSGRISVHHSLTERLDAGSSFSYINTSSDAGTTSNSFLVVFPVNYKYSETFSTSGHVGARYTVTTANGTEQPGDAGWLAGFDLLKKFDIGSVKLSMERALYPSGFGTLKQKDQAILNLNVALSDTVSAGFATRYIRNELIGADNSASANLRNREYLQIGPTLRWQWSRDWAVMTGYAFTQQDFRGQSGSGNAVFLNVGYAFEELFLPD